MEATYGKRNPELLWIVAMTHETANVKGRCFVPCYYGTLAQQLDAISFTTSVQQNNHLK